MLPSAGLRRSRRRSSGGHIDAAFTNSTMMVSTRDQIKVLAMGAPERMKQLADVPTFKELGYRDVSEIARGVMAPKALPQAIQEISGEGADGDDIQSRIRAKMEQAGFVPQGLGIADSHKYLDAEVKELQKLIQDFGLKSNPNSQTVVQKGWYYEKISLWCLAVAFLLVPGLAIGAADFPKGPITYIIPFNPGGQSDVEARLQQPYLEKILGTKIIVEYKPGAGGALAWTQFSKAKPDGYSVCGINIPPYHPAAALPEGCRLQDGGSKAPVHLRIDAHRSGGEEGVENQHAEGIHRICQGKPRQDHRRYLGQALRSSHGVAAV